MSLTNIELTKLVLIEAMHHSKVGEFTDEIVECVLREVRKIKDPDTIQISWSIDDIKGQNESLSDDQAREILGIIDRRHDASIGINWDVINCHIDMYLRDEDDTRIAEVITRADGIEIHPMHFDADSGDTMPADTDNPLTHYGVYAHLKEDHVEWLRDFEYTRPQGSPVPTVIDRSQRDAKDFASKFNLPVVEV